MLINFPRGKKFWINGIFAYKFPKREKVKKKLQKLADEEHHLKVTVND
jgi:hypothetical protein